VTIFVQDIIGHWIWLLQKILVFFSLGKFTANGFGLWPDGALVLSAAADFNAEQDYELWDMMLKFGCSYYHILSAFMQNQSEQRA
jgi:hypothetical protein